MYSHVHVLVLVALLQFGADCSIRNTDGKTALDMADPSAHFVLSGEYQKEELLEAARTGNIEVLQSLLTPINVNCHADDGRKVLVEGNGGGWKGRKETVY